MNDEMNRFSELDDINRKFISDAIMIALTTGRCSPSILKDNLQNVPMFAGVLTDGIYQQMMVLLSNMGIIEPLYVSHEDTDDLYCIIHCWNNLAPDIKELLIATGHTESDVRAILKELPDDKKEIISKIVDNSEEEWYEVADAMPPEDMNVAIRIYNPTMVAQENDRQKILVEDISVAKWTGAAWKISGPYPCVDYSPLVQRNKVNEENGAVVSHWRHITAEELSNWIHRYDPIRDYEYLDIIVDDENRTTVYRALVHGSNLLERASKDPNIDETTQAGLKDLSNVLNDLAGCLDREEGVYLEPKLALHKLDAIRANVVNLITYSELPVDTDGSEDK